MELTDNFKLRIMKSLLSAKAQKEQNLCDTSNSKTKTEEDSILKEGKQNRNKCKGIRQRFKRYKHQFKDK